MEIPDKYEGLLQTLRDLYREAGASHLGSPRSHGGLRNFGASQEGRVELVFDYGTLHMLKVPEGSINPICGCSRSWDHGDRFKALCQEHFDVTEIEPLNPSRKMPQITASGPVWAIQEKA